MDMALRRGVILAIAFGFTMFVSSASAQFAKSELEIKADLQASVRYLRMAIVELGDRNRALELNQEGYVQLRAGHAKLINWIAKAKFPDPRHKLAVPKLQEARGYVLGARDAIQYSDGVPSERAESLMADAIRIIEMVLRTSL